MTVILNFAEILNAKKFMFTKARLSTRLILIHPNAAPYAKCILTVNLDLTTSYKFLFHHERGVVINLLRFDRDKHQI